MEEKYQEFINLPYFKIHKAPTYEEWLKMQNNQPLLKADTRSEWQKKQSADKKKEILESELLYKNLHLWNLIPGLGGNILLTKDNTKLLYNFNKDITNSMLMSGTMASVPAEGIHFSALHRLAKLKPHGFLNLYTNAAILGTIGTVGSTIGSELEKRTLGTNGITGGTVFGLGSIYGFNKIPFMKDFNKALIAKYISNKDIDRNLRKNSGFRYKFGGNKNSTLSVSYPNETNEHLPDVIISESPSENVLAYRLPSYNNVELHLGDGNTVLSTSDKLWAGRFVNQLPSGTYLSSYSPATSRTLRIQQKGIFNSFLNKKLRIDNPVTVDGYKTLLSMRKSPNFETLWSDSHYMTEFHFGENPLDKLFYNLYHTFINNPSNSNLNSLNNYIVSLGGKPAKYINGELQIPFPILLKK